MVIARTCGMVDSDRSCFCAFTFVRRLTALLRALCATDEDAGLYARPAGLDPADRKGGIFRGTDDAAWFEGRRAAPRLGIRAARRDVVAWRGSSHAPARIDGRGPSRFPQITSPGSD